MTDLVLIKDVNKPRMKWRKGRVEKSIEGKRGLVRGCRDKSVLIKKGQNSYNTSPITINCSS